jgi:general secretion pathway protein A
MYAPHFGLTDEAFSLTPDPLLLFLSPVHAEARAALKIGLRARRGLIVMTGEVGTGKTTLLYSLLSERNDQIHTAYISNTKLTFEEMLRVALADFGVPCDSRERLELLTVLNAFLLRCAADGTTAALVIDEAQNLDDDVFEHLRLLSNFETFTQKLLQIVLVGQPELDAKLSRPSLRQIAERVAVRCHLEPLTRRQSLAYIEHRLQAVGGSLDLFSRGALRLIIRKSGGIPRRINILCHNALLFAYGAGTTQVSFSFARAAARQRAAGSVRQSELPGAATLPGRMWQQPLWARVGVIAVVGAAVIMPWGDAPVWRRFAASLPRLEAALLTATSAVTGRPRAIAASPRQLAEDPGAAGDGTGEACVRWTSRLSVETMYRDVNLDTLTRCVLTAPRMPDRLSIIQNSARSHDEMNRASIAKGSS